MEIVRGVESLPLDRGPQVATVGFFDGVHVGHQRVIGRTVEVAREKRLPPVAVTFNRHPREILTPGKEPRLLTTTERKAKLIEALGVEILVILEFTEEFSKWSPKEFARRVLVEGLQVEHAVVGANFTFGHKAMGTVEVLKELGTELGFAVEGVELLQLDGRRVSSSSIRDALSEGSLDWPERALGRRYAVDGEVVSGHGRGDGLGYPTANLRTWPRLLLPGNGIYAGRASVGGATYAAAIDVGTNPTFGVEPLHVEAFLLDFEGDLRGERLDVEFWARLRDEVKFDSPEELTRQIADDVERTRAIAAPTSAR
ncbi:MAG: bifunctional riboflavin kinase/FAD synthetase [Actinomycetota bacterium]